MQTSHSSRHRPKKSLGQNFLVDHSFIARIVAAVDPRESDTVFEIGPGHGAITEALVDAGANVVAMELDSRLIEPLKQRFASSGTFQVVEMDALDADFRNLVRNESSDPRATAKLVANLPYYISTAILQRLALQRVVFSSLVLMFQREVVDRITANTNSSERGYLTVLAEAAFEIVKLFDVPPNAFRPVPKVSSSVVKLTPKEPNFADSDSFRKLVSAAFSQKRKTIANSLKPAYPGYTEALKAAGIDPRSRAEALSLDDWKELASAIGSVR